MNGVTQVPRVRGVEALAAAVERATPVVIEGLATEWPLLEALEPSAFRERFGDVRVPVASVGEDGAVYDPRRGVRYEETSVREYVDGLLAGSRRQYLSVPAARYFPQLDALTRPPREVERASYRHARVWIAAEGQGGPLHVDLPNNLYVQG